MQNVVHANACDAVKEEPQEVSRGRTGTSHTIETGQRHSLNSLHSNFMADLTESDDDEASEAESFILDPEELEEEPVLDTSKFLLTSEGGGEDSPPEVGTVDPDTQARLEALLEATGLSKLSLEGKQLGDPEVLRRLTTSVSCALDEAAAALTRMRAEHAPPANPTNTTTTTSVTAVPMPPQGTHQTSRTLAEACSDGDVRAVRQLLDEGRDVNEVTEEGESLLSLACASGYTELAQLLLAMRANVEDRGLKDTTPLMEAANAGHVAIVRLLIEHGADVNAQTAQGHTPLMFACSGGHEEVARALVAAGANVEDHNENGHTPLMEAASAGHVSTARVLVEAGASINTHSNEFKESALTLACYKGHLEMVRFLLEAGADQEHKTDEMHTALMEASMDGHVEVARLLLDSGAQVNMPTDSFESPLTLAACGGHVELAMLLLERGANIEEVNDEGYTPLMEAAREGHEEMVALLLSQGADINAQTEETQETALTLACCGGFLEVADFLLKAGANLELGASTPLMEAAQEGHVELLRYLVNAGACVNAKTATGDTALTYACENGHTDVADLLLQANADLEHESEGGRTPLMKAARAGHLCTVQFLLSRGADPNRPTANNDHTALSLACAGGHLAVVELLLAHGADPTRRLRDNSTMLIEAAKGGHTAVVQLLLDYPNLGPSAVAASVEASSRFGSHGLQVVPLTEEQRVAALAAAAASHPYFPQVTSAPAPAPPVALSSRVGATSSTGSTDSTWTCGGSTGSKRKASDGGGPPMVVCSGAGSRLASGVEGGGAAIRPSERLEACINSMMRSAELNHPSREEQILQKQQILEELQRVERELQEKAQAQIVLSGHHHHQHPPTLPCEDVEELNLRNAALSSSASPADAGCASLPPHSATCPVVASTATTTIVTPVTPAVAKRHLDKTKSTKSSPSIASKEATSPAVPVATTATSSAATSSPSTALHLHTQPPVLGLAGTTSVYPPTATTSLLPGATFTAPAVDEGLMVAAPARTLHETLGDIVTGPSASSTAAQVSITAQQSVCPDHHHHHHHHHHHGATHPVLSQQQPPPPPLAFHPFPVHSQVDLNWQTESNHDTALTLACAGGHEELVSLLLTRGAHLEHRDKKGFTPLMLAATAGHAGVVDVLLAHGAEVEAQSERTKDTALSLACSGGRYEVVEILLERNANKEHRNVSDYTPLSLAASGGYVNIIKLLLQNGAEINSRTGSKLGISPLMLAAMNGHTAAVKLLLDNGSDINAQIETNKNTALTLACFQGRQEVVALLVDRKANVEHRAKTGLTPLMEAASGGYVEVGRVLLDKGADVNAPPVPSSRDTALTIAADKGHYAFVELLIKRGAQIDVKNKKGSSPLWLACNGGHLDVVQLLVAAQADIDSMDNRRVSCLMAAFRKGHVKAAKWLVKHVAQFPSDQEMARFMATLGADSKDLLRKCHQCTEVIHAAKERQAAEANKCASILLEELDQERSREESRKAAAARRRERKRRRKKEKQEQIRLAKLAAEGGGESENKDGKEANKDSDKDSKNSGDKQVSSQSEDEDEEEEEEAEEDMEEEDERLVHPGGASASSHRSNSSSSVSLSNSTGKTKNSQMNGATNNKHRLKPADDDSHNTAPHQYSNHNESSSSSSSSPPKVEKSSSRNKKKQQQADRAANSNHDTSLRAGNNSSTLTASTTSSSKGKGSGEKGSRNNASSAMISTVVSSSNHRQSGGKKGSEVLVNGLLSESEDSSGVPKGPKHRSYHSGNDVGKLNALDELVLEMSEGPCGGLRSPNLNRGLDRPSPNSSSPKKQGSSLVNSINSSLNSSLMSNKIHHRGEEGWKEVVRRSKKVTVPSNAISRVIGRCGCNINTIREVSGAHIEVEKHKGQGDRTILIRGSADATKQAQLLITGLVQEPERDLSEIMQQYGVGVKTSEPTPTATRGSSGLGTTAASSNHVQSSVVVAGGTKPIRQPSSTKVMSVKAAAPTPSLPPFGQTRPAPRPGIPTGSSNVPVPTSSNPPFAASSWSMPIPPGAKGAPTPISSVSQPMPPASMNSSCASSSVNPLQSSAASTTYTQAVISPAKSANRAASADARPLSSPTGSPSPAPPQPPSHSHSAASTPPAALAAPPISIPQTFSPFNNVFSKETQPSVWGQREALKPNFASVAASGVCCSSASSSTSSTGNPLPAPSPEPIIDAAKAPGYRGNLHVSPPNFGPIGSGPRSAPCTPPISAPAPHSASPSPPPQQQEYYDASQSTPQQPAVASPASRLVFPGGRYCQELSQSPIQSTLNPNAPDFSSRAAPAMMPPFVGPPPSAHDLRVQFPPQDYLAHHPSQQPHHVQHQQMAQQGHHPSMYQLQMMSHLQQQYSGLVAQVPQHQIGKDDSSPSSVSPQGAMSPTTGSGLGPHQSGMVDDRKLPRPIGTERAQKKNVPVGIHHSSYPPPSAPGIWSYPNTAGNSGSSEMSQMAAWMQYQHAAGPQGDCLPPPLLHGRFGEGHSDTVLEHTYHQQQQLNSNLGTCPTFLNGFPPAAPTAAPQVLGGCAGTQLFPSSRDPPHPQEAPWSPHKLLQMDAMHHHQPPHPHSAAGKLPWQGWAHHQT